MKKPIPMITKTFRMSEDDLANVLAIQSALGIRSRGEALRFALKQTRIQLVGKAKKAS